MDMDKLQDRLAEETKAYNELASNVEQGKKDIASAEKELDVRLGRIQVQQELLMAAESLAKREEVEDTSEVSETESEEKK